MDILANLLSGFAVALKPINLVYALAGTVVGTITGILPGLGPLGAMAILLSFTLYLDATGAMILFAGIYYGAMYGGSTTSILLNIPGESASVVTCLDGYQMAKKGRAGAALCVAAMGSFVAGTISIVGLMFAASALSGFALKFGPPEFFAIGVCGLVLLVRLSGESAVKSIVMTLLGLSIATIGLDYVSGVERYCFGSYQLGQGIELLPVAMGIFGVGEILKSAEEKDRHTEVAKVRLRDLFPTRKEWRRSVNPVIRGSILGFVIGLIPGPSHVISTFVSYIAEKRLSKHPEEFGKGAIEGIAGPEASNNAAVGGAYVPLLALGVPFTPALAVVLGALLLHGVTPGPNLVNEKPELFWGVIASMYIGNFMLLVLNLPLVKVFVSVLLVPKRLLLPLLIILCVVGVYSLNSSYLDLTVLGVCGVLGYVIRGLGFEPAPLVLALVLGPMIETSLRQSLSISSGDMSVLFLRPICLTLYVVVAIFLAAPYLARWVKRKSMKEEEKCKG
ncbi:MAG: tripartite tricarboxylate transporter permease [Thermodesulfobacteriota bacterium]